MNAFLNNRMNIDFVDVALGSTAGFLTASVAEQCIVLKNHEAEDIVPLKIAPLDQFADLHPNFIKMDIEGAEIDALEGAGQILREKPSFYIEMHPAFLPRFNKTAMEVFRFFSLDDYLCFINYPGKEALLRYERQFDLQLPCALFFVPKSQPPMVRFYTKEKALKPTTALGKGMS